MSNIQQRQDPLSSRPVNTAGLTANRLRGEDETSEALLSDAAPADLFNLLYGNSTTPGSSLVV
ncbi:hypothetical protein M0657_001410 [Pyricularia oryzae]|uniref:Uncharacterized protein n=1 Tax=Pyricularia oryzae TaxID=318829 RepID=A0A4P7MYV0_PYROR|nr:hypothetical protein M9X92_001195 [Pyricularia oryzae]KAI7931048.1 hypothetical protein M0657_001410 [Pyricularia oryzae]QBZ54252.1 hypothetical protein PoMZ_09948 [Pyricularia oryzae]